MTPTGQIQDNRFFREWKIWPDGVITPNPAPGAVESILNWIVFAQGKDYFWSKRN